MNLAIGLVIPFLGTILGSAMVFIMKDVINEKIEKLYLIHLPHGKAGRIYDLSKEFKENRKEEEI